MRALLDLLFNNRIFKNKYGKLRTIFKIAGLAAAVAFLPSALGFLSRGLGSIAKLLTGSKISLVSKVGGFFGQASGAVSGLAANGTVNAASSFIKTKAVPYVVAHKEAAAAVVAVAHVEKNTHILKKTSQKVGLSR